ncbi:hypothetical protein [Allofustis seminis]|uniref:hypothetical protein n=1 Tax=Allofustis seminis TaxID=166939 RepID=UPI00037F1DE7|nr:hypothetical protein [Allofustis seminis]
MQKSIPKKEFFKWGLLASIISLMAVFFYWLFGKSFAQGWLLGMVFVTILQLYRKWMYPRIFNNLRNKGRVILDVMSHQFLVLLIVLMPFALSIKHGQKYSILAIFLAFFCERIYWIVSHYFNEKRRV